MKIIVCVDDNYGFSFNNRRQSQDRNLISFLCEKFKESTIKIKSYSSRLFSDYLPIDEFDKNSSINSNIKLINNVFEYRFYDINSNDYLFVEQFPDFIDYKKYIDEIVYCHWNKKYPADVFCPKPEEISNDFRLVSEEIICGSSHDKINIKIYKK